MKQFLIEAVMLTGIGGLIGVVLGVTLSLGGALLPKLVPSFLTLTLVLVSFLVSLVTKRLLCDNTVTTAAQRLELDRTVMQRLIAELTPVRQPKQFAQEQAQQTQ